MPKPQNDTEERTGGPPTGAVVEWVRAAVMGLIPRPEWPGVSIEPSVQLAPGFGRDGPLPTLHVHVVGPQRSMARVIGRRGDTFRALRHVVHRVAFVNSIHVRFHVSPTGDGAGMPSDDLPEEA